MRNEVSRLLTKGSLPSSSSSVERIEEWQSALEKIAAPLSDEEAKSLVTLFPEDDDDCFGLAWTLIHLIETSPHWPLRECLDDLANPWQSLLRARCMT